MKQRSTILHADSSDSVGIEIPMVEGFKTWCVENQGKSLNKTEEYVYCLQKVGSRCWNENLLGFFEDVREAFESATGSLYEVVGYQIYVRRELENQQEMVLWYASLSAEKVTPGDMSAATYRKWATALKEYCRYLEYLTYKNLERSGYGGETESNCQPDEAEFVKLERQAKRVALCGYVYKLKNREQTDKQFDQIQVEPFIKMRKGKYDSLLSPQPSFPLADAYKKWFKSQPATCGTRYNYTSVLNTVYIDQFKENEQWNALLHEPSPLSKEYVNSLRSAILLRISEVSRHEKEQGKASSFPAASTAAVESYIRFLKSLLKE